MEAVRKLEEKLNKMLVKDAPFQLPENFRSWLANYSWLFALIGVILGGLALLALLTGVLFASAVTTTYTYGYPVEITQAKHYLFLAWIALLVLAAYLVVLAIAVPKLKKMEKRGWDLMYYSALFFIGYDIFNWLQFPSAVGTLIFNLIGAVIGLYFLFQIRGKFTSSKAPVAVKK